MKGWKNINDRLMSAALGKGIALKWIFLLYVPLKVVVVL